MTNRITLRDFVAFADEDVRAPSERLVSGLLHVHVAGVATAATAILHVMSFHILHVMVFHVLHVMFRCHVVGHLGAATLMFS
ncbi:MAG TPA: hypothetical protein VLA93_21360 [Pyrinomonadaceae bacterium]|nr:hypothetical protein [Pyrinomonadaceae bacterium]